MENLPVTQNLPVPIGPQRLRLEYVDVCVLNPNKKNARKHPRQQIAKLIRGITEFGWGSPILIDAGNNIIAGHARLQAAVQMGQEQVPCIRLVHLTQAQAKALAISDNKIGDQSFFDPVALAAVLSELLEADIDIELTGFETAEIDAVLALPETLGEDPVDNFEVHSDAAPVSCTGDLWQLGPHKLLCGDSRNQTAYARLLETQCADMVFADPPYNVPINKNVSGLGRVTHREFAMASGEMRPAEFVGFLRIAMELLASVSKSGSIHYFCMDWRHMRELQEAAGPVYSELKALIVWVKTNGGMGSFYRSQHELIFAYKFGTAPHRNNVQLGRHGRNRTNVWTYPGANAFGATRAEDLSDHPTVKPVALVADAIRDCSPRKGLILDPFAGSGVTLLAAERTGRTAAAIEIDPVYVDVAVRRWQKATGKKAILQADGRSFDELAAVRRANT